MKTIIFQRENLNYLIVFFTLSVPCFFSIPLISIANLFAMRYLWDVCNEDKCLHQEPGQKPDQPGKGWPGQAFRVFGQAYQKKAAWESLASMATAKIPWQPWPPKLGLPGLVTSKAELSRQPWSKKPGLIQALKIQARLDRAFLNFQAKNL